MNEFSCNKCSIDNFIILIGVKNTIIITIKNDPQSKEK